MMDRCINVTIAPNVGRMKNLYKIVHWRKIPFVTVSLVLGGTALRHVPRVVICFVKMVEKSQSEIKHIVVQLQLWVFWYFKLSLKDFSFLNSQKCVNLVCTLMFPFCAVRLYENLLVSVATFLLVDGNRSRDWNDKKQKQNDSLNLSFIVDFCPNLQNLVATLIGSYSQISFYCLKSKWLILVHD